MSSEWLHATLGEICSKQNGAIQTGPFGSQLHTSDYKEVGIPVVMPTNIGDGGIATDGIARIDCLDVERLQQHKLQLNDIVFSRRGDVTKNALIRTEEVGWLCGTGCLKVRLGEERIANPKFISYYLRLSETKEWLVRHAVGATMPNLNTGILSAVPITLPPLKTQLEIAAILGALDDRITLLRETNATLEAIAQALFKSWFVDFDPVRAKQEGRAPEGMDEATAALFPDALEETELGPMPRGWRVGCVDDLCSVITNGGTPSRSKAQFWTGGTIPWFKTGEFSDGFLLQPNEFITKEALEGSSVKVLPKDAVLMAIYAAPTVGRLGVLTEPATFNQACTGMVAKVDVGPWFLYWTLFFGREWFNSRANGAAQQNISKAIVSAYRVVIPHDVILLAFNDVASSIHNRVRENAEQAQTLATLRDTLLPRLISGQLRVPEASEATLA